MATPTNQFTSQSAWGTARLSAPTTIAIASADTYVNPELSLVAGSMYNISYSRGVLQLNGNPLGSNLWGKYLFNVSFTTSGATNNTLSCRFKYEYVDADLSTTKYLYSYGVEYDSKGGHKWAVNQSVIMDIPNAIYGKVSLEWKNIDADADIELDGLIMNVIKLY